MGKKRKGHKKAAAPVYDSDDERAYADEKVPNQQDSDYYEDDVDRFHTERDKIMLEKGTNLHNIDPSSDEEEVLAFDDSDDDDDEIADYEERLRKFKSMGFKDELASDIEDVEEEDEDKKVWGGKKNRYYGDDMDDYDDVESGGSGTEAAILEEKEAREIQKRMTDQLADDDFQLDLFKAPQKEGKTEKDDSKVVIPKDLSKLSKKEKMKLLEKDSPELPELVKEYKEKMEELRSRWLPIFRLIQSGKLPDSNAVTYIQTKVKLYLNYCTNVSFYLVLKAKRTPVANHPVINRIVQYRNLIAELRKADDILSGEVDELLNRIKSGEQLVFNEAKPIYIKRKKILQKDKSLKKNKKKLSELMQESDDSETEGKDNGEMIEGGRSWGRKRKTDIVGETHGEKEALEYYQMMKRKKSNDSDEEDDEQYDEQADEMDEEADDNENDEEDETGKRGITYQIEKNKGLTPKRKKDQRNPRVKHRMKFRKAKIRRRGQIRDVRKEITPYGGEISGIRAGIKRGIKLKG